MSITGLLDLISLGDCAIFKAPVAVVKLPILKMGESVKVLLLTLEQACFYGVRLRVRRDVGFIR